jgi:hypothetical protein
MYRPNRQPHFHHQHLGGGTQRSPTTGKAENRDKGLNGVDGRSLFDSAGNPDSAAKETREI